MEENNRTASMSPRDYAMTLKVFSYDMLVDETVKNQWLEQHLQVTDIDFHARWEACRLELHNRHITLDNPPSL